MLVDTPFIEVEIIQTQDNARDILRQLEKKSIQNHHVRSSWLGTEKKPILRVDYESLEHFVQSYTRDKLIYENFIKYINLQDVSLNNTHNLANPNENDDDLYLMVKYRTNYKEPIRKNYSFTFKIVELLRVGASYEEVSDGFILFYKNKEDYIVGQWDLLNIDKSIDYLKSRGFYTPSIESSSNKLKLKPSKRNPLRYKTIHARSNK